MTSERVKPVLRSGNKENVRKAFEKGQNANDILFNSRKLRADCSEITLRDKGTTSSHSGLRNPLGDLSGNILPQKNSIRTTVLRSVSTVKNLKTSETKLRSNSASQVETNVKFVFKSENITVRRVNDKFISNVDEVFVQGEEHFLNYLPDNQKPGSSSFKTKLSKEETEIIQPVPVVRVSLPSAARAQKRKPAQKTTLVRRLSIRRKRFTTDEIYKNCLYDEDYFEDNYSYMLEVEGKFVYRKHYLKQYLDENFRMIIVNWLIYVQQILELAENTFFIGIRMFDYIILTARVPCNKYILVGITCMWIANKKVDVQFILVPKLFSICNGKFSKDQIISMEKEILRVLKFNINFPEPATFLHYYLKKENLESNPTILHSAMFLLETFTLLLDFSSLTPSLLAAIALYIVLLKNNLDATSFLEYIEDHLLEKEIFVRKSEQMEDCVKHLLTANCVTTEVKAKYLTEDRCCVAKYFVSE